jgi:hypothetical protein
VEIGLINNLRAGRNSRLVGRILDVLREYPNVHHVETDQAGALPDALADLARREIDLLVVNGGDGTLQHALTEILANDVFQHVPRIAPLRGGRTNMTAMDLGADSDPVRGLRAVLEAARTGRLHERRVNRPVLRVGFDRGRRVEYGMFYGAGMIHRAIALVHQMFPPGSGQGAFGAGVLTMALVAKTMWRPREGLLRPDKIDIHLDGLPVNGGEFRLTISTSLRRLFWRLDPFWGAGPGPVRFTCIGSDARHIASAAPRILWGRPAPFLSPENGYTSRNVERAELRLSCGFTIDGELFAPRDDEVVTLAADRRITFVRA